MSRKCRFSLCPVVTVVTDAAVVACVRDHRRTATAVALLALAVLLGGFQPLSAALVPRPITVNSVDESFGCTLAKAIANANANSQLHAGCEPGGESPNDRIDFAPELLAGGHVELPGDALPTISDTLEILGPGAELVTVRGGSNGIFTTMGVFVSISNLTLKGGDKPAGLGGAAFATGGILSLLNVRVVGNRAGRGGGIAVIDGTLGVHDSEISRNVAMPGSPADDGAGGGIYFLSSQPNASPRQLGLTDVTISGNAAEDAGGGVAVRILDGAGDVSFTALYVTLANNGAGTAGGGIYLEPHAASGGTIDANIRRVAGAGNTATSGPDLFESSDTDLEVTYSVLATATGYTADDFQGSLNADPQLTPLGCNGGQTLTHLLAPSSPAIDIFPGPQQSDICAFQRDQRGVERRNDGNGDSIVGCDAGALEHRFPQDIALRSFHTVLPCRIADTRNAPGPNGGPAIDANEIRTFGVFDFCGVPYWATGVALNVTVVGASNAGSLLVFEGDYLAPPNLEATTVVPYPAAGVRSNNATVSVCPSRTIKVLPQQAAGSVDVIVDVVGFWD